MGHGQGAEMENPGIGDGFLRQLALGQHHIRAGLAIEGKVPVTVGEGLDKSQRGGDFGVYNQMVRVDARFQNGMLQ